MPTVNVVVWNIQNFGNQGDNQRMRRGVNNVLLGQFLDSFVRDFSVDILMIMEVSPNAAPALAAVQGQLNAARAAGWDDWAMDWIKCSTRQPAAGLFGAAPVYNPPQSSADLSFAGSPYGARYEGYAVYWRSNQAARFSLESTPVWISEGAVDPAGMAPGIGFLDLVQYGRPYGAVGGYWQVNGGFTAPNVYPFLHGVLMAAWPQLGFPSVSMFDADGPLLYFTRRPAYVVVNLVRPGQPASACLQPIIAYHAPSNARRASFGTGLAALSRELYATQDPATGNLVAIQNAVAGGDFNLAIPIAAWPGGDYEMFLQPYAAGGGGGAAATSVVYQGADGLRKTTVHLQEAGVNINSRYPDDYLTLPIDQIFSRGLAINANPRGMIQMVQQLYRDNGAQYGAVLQAWYAHLVAEFGAYGTAARPGTRIDANSGPQVWAPFPGVWQNVLTAAWGAPFTDWNGFLADLNAGRFRTVRAAAEFFVMFISDHLPLIYSYDF